MTDQPLHPSPILARLLAAVFDYSAIMVLVLVVQQVWTTSQDGRTVPTAASNVLAIVVVVAWFVVPHATSGATFGKRLCRLVLVRANDEPAGWWRSTVRFVVAFAAYGLGPIIAALDEGPLWWVLAIAQVVIPLGVYAPIVLRDDRRGLHDLAAGTAVRSTVPPLSELINRR